MNYINMFDRNKMIAATADTLLNGLFTSCRLKVWGEEDHARALSEHGKLIYASWHHDFPFNAWYFRNRAIVVPVSLSRDGDLVAALLERLGYRLARGSSRRGGQQAFLQMLKLVRQGCSGGFTCDGPIGPAYVAKPGVITLAARTGAPILPVVSDASPCHEFSSWDRTILPLPGAGLTVAFGAKPILIPKGLSPAEYENCRIELSEQLNRLTAQTRLATRLKLDSDPRELELPPDYLKWLPRRDDS